MSFINNVKQEIIKNNNKTLNKSNSLSFLYGLFKAIGEINIVTNEIVFLANNEEIFNLTNNCLTTLGFQEAELEITDERNFKTSFKYKIIINNVTSKTLLHEFLYKTEFNFNDNLVKTASQKTEFIKALFICCGTGNISLNGEQTGYLIEFVLNDKSLALELSNLLSEFEIFAKLISRRVQHVVYINKFDVISDLFALLGANSAVLEINNENILRSVRNNINRQNNCTEANINKTINASLNQINAINFISSTIGIESLDANLQEICLLRLANKEESLDNLVKLMGGKISKSGLNHRLKKIIKISNELKGKF